MLLTQQSIISLMTVHIHTIHYGNLALSPRLPSHCRSQYSLYQCILILVTPPILVVAHELYIHPPSLSPISPITNSEALSYANSSPFSSTFNTTLFYRPTSPSIDPFLDEFRIFLHTISPNTIILGDLNFPNLPSLVLSPPGTPHPY